MAETINTTGGQAYLTGTTGPLTSTGTVSGTELLVNGPAGSAQSIRSYCKLVTGVPDATATTVFTISVPNGTHGALIRVHTVSFIGAGGTVGAGEACISGTFSVAVTRVVNVAAASAAASFTILTSSAAVASGTSISQARSLVAWSGATNATNTQAIQMTITKGGGSSDNHSILLMLDVVNLNGNGITIS